MDKKPKIGRPSIYTEELAKEICDAIATQSKSLRQLCKENPHWPDRNTIFEWNMNRPEFSCQYTQARRNQIQTFIDDIIEISDNIEEDSKINEDGELVINKEWIARSRLRVDSRKWLACKLVPKVYGDRVNVSNDETPDNPLLNEALERQKQLDKDNEKEF